jgi:O-antigen/teichoic acid export membrane protein
VNLWTGVLTSYLAAVGRPDIEARYAIVAMLVNLGATAALVIFGPRGVAGGGAFAAIVASLYLLRVVRKRYRTETVSFLKDVPVLPALITLIVTVILEKVAQPYAPQGALGLIFSGLPAVVGLLVYGFAVLGRRSGPFLRVLLKKPVEVSKLVELAFLA